MDPDPRSHPSFALVHPSPCSETREKDPSREIRPRREFPRMGPTSWTQSPICMEYVSLSASL